MCRTWVCAEEAATDTDKSPHCSDPCPRNNEHKVKIYVFCLRHSIKIYYCPVHTAHEPEMANDWHAVYPMGQLPSLFPAARHRASHLPFATVKMHDINSSAIVAKSSVQHINSFRPFVRSFVRSHYVQGNQHIS